MKTRDGRSAAPRAARPDSFKLGSAVRCAVCFSFFFLLHAPLLWAQAGQSYVFSAAYIGGDTTKPAIAVFTRDDANGTLSQVSGSPFAVRDLPANFALDVQSRFQYLGSFETYAISASDGSLSSLNNNTSLSVLPENISVDTTGQWLDIGGPGSVLLYELSTLAESAASPLAGYVSTAEWSVDPTASFLAVPGNGIDIFPVDPATGLIGATPVANSPFAVGVASGQVYFARPGNQQPVSGPAVAFSPSTLSFGSITVGQTSAALSLKITSTGDQSLSISSISIAGTNSGNFQQTNTCQAPTVLAPATFCMVSLLYAPSAAGNSQASLTIYDDAAGSPHLISLAGTGVAPSPEVTLVPGNLTFPGSTTQGTSSAPQTIAATNAGSAPLQISSVSLGGLNAQDFSISANGCTGALAANASCNLTLVFSPLAAGTRSTTLTIIDNAPNSPQTISVSGNAPAAASIGAGSSGNTTASVTAGQTAQFNLQATPGAGFSGVLTFSCSGTPQAATCVPPTSVAITSGSPATFTISVKTSVANAFIVPHVETPRFPQIGPRLFVSVLLSVWAALWLSRFTRRGNAVQGEQTWRTCLSCAALLCGLAGCGGGSNSPAPATTPPPQILTPVGTYTISVLPTATAAGSSTPLALDPVSLTLTVK